MTLSHSTSSRTKFAGRLLATLVLVALGGAVHAGCKKDDQMDPNECDKIRSDAFKLMTEGQNCTVDADCKEAEWPQCRRAVNKKTFDSLAEMQKKVDAGKCDEKGFIVCKDSPPVYCKQGLCTLKETGTAQ